MRPPMESAGAFGAEARRLAAIADEAEEQLSALLVRAEAAQDTGAPSPPPGAVDAARRRAEQARAAADTAQRFARREAAWREARLG